jgi:hypothetical protein
VLLLRKELWCRSHVKVLEFIFCKESCFYASKFFQLATAFSWKETGIFSVVKVWKEMCFGYGENCCQVWKEHVSLSLSLSLSLSRCCFSYGRNAHLDFLEKSCVSVLFGKETSV